MRRQAGVVRGAGIEIENLEARQLADMDEAVIAGQFLVNIELIEFGQILDETEAVTGRAVAGDVELPQVG